MAKAKFVANKESKMVHAACCGAVKQIKKNNKQNFSSKKLAQKKKFKCCKLCCK